MQAQAFFGFQQLVTELVRGLADAVADRPGETEAQRFARHQTAIFSVMAFLPRDAMETTLASHCVMYDLALRDAAAELLRNEAEPVKRRIRSQVITIGRLFFTSLKQLQQLQARPSQQTAPTPQGGPPDSRAQSDAEVAAQPSSVGVESRTANVETLSPQRSGGSQPEATGDGDEIGVPQQHGFQNRQMRRALQFKKPASNRVSGRSGQPAMASRSAATSGQRDG
jgi:hypothetical protein